MTRRVFLDMDGVVVDFEGYLRHLNETIAFSGSAPFTGDDVKRSAGAYANMLPIPGALDGVRSIIGMGFDVWLATKPPTGISWAYADKAEWVFKHLPELKRKLIITHDKGMLGSERDILVDDRPHRANCEAFRGMLVSFGFASSELVKKRCRLATAGVCDWQELLAMLGKIAPNRERSSALEF
jgi:5'(3')-deoxyribonucleotidase